MEFLPVRDFLKLETPELLDEKYGGCIILRPLDVFEGNIACDNGWFCSRNKIWDPKLSLWSLGEFLLLISGLSLIQKKFKILFFFLY